MELEKKFEELEKKFEEERKEKMELVEETKNLKRKIEVSFYPSN